jgi:hypothetical protein
MMQYVYWQDDSKTPTATKIAAAIAAHVRRLGTRPNVVLVSNDDDAPAAVGDVRVEKCGRMKRGDYWAGVE